MAERKNASLSTYGWQCKMGSSLWKQACGLSRDSQVAGVATTNRCELLPDGACNPGPYVAPPPSCTLNSAYTAWQTNAKYADWAAALGSVLPEPPPEYVDKFGVACTVPPPPTADELTKQQAMRVHAYKRVPTSAYDDTLRGGPVPQDWGACQARWKEMKTHCRWGAASTYAFNGRFPIDPESYPSVALPASSSGKSFGYFALHFVKDFVVRIAMAALTDGVSEIYFGVEEVAEETAKVVAKEVGEALEEAFVKELKTLVVEETVNRSISYIEEAEDDIDGGTGVLSTALEKDDTMGM
jgi:hypothetical protein